MNSFLLFAPLQLAPIIELYLLMTLSPAYLRLVCRWSIVLLPETTPSREAFEQVESCLVATGEPLRLRRRFAMGPKLPIVAWLDPEVGGPTSLRFAPFGLSFLLISVGFTLTSLGVLASGSDKLSLWQLALLGAFPPLMTAGLLAYWVGLSRSWLVRVLGEADADNASNVNGRYRSP